jgi:hypothetical protein
VANGLDGRRGDRIGEKDRGSMPIAVRKFLSLVTMIERSIGLDNAFSRRILSFLGRATR